MCSEDHSSTREDLAEPQVGRDASWGWWDSTFFEKLECQQRPAGGESPSLGVLWRECFRKAKEQEQRLVGNYYMGSKTPGSPVHLTPDEQRGEKLGTAWCGTFDSNFTLSAMEYHQWGLNVKCGTSFPPLYFILELLRVWLTDTQHGRHPKYIEKLGNPVLLRYACVRVHGDGGSRFGEEGPLPSTLGTIDFPE